MLETNLGQIGTNDFLPQPVRLAAGERHRLSRRYGIRNWRAIKQTPPPPWRGVPPPLSVYRERGHRRLAARTYEEKCTTCIWGCQMAVEMIIDHWNPSKRRYRTETFCYGPRSCSLYGSGPARKVPGRHGMSYTEED